MALNGYDIAGVNGSGIITTALKGAFIICKATEGITFDDPQHDTFVAKLRAAGKLVGHYHYARPYNDPVREADHFVGFAKARAGETLWLDFEPYEGHVGVTDHTVWPEWILAFCGRVKARTGASCGVYLNDWFANEVLRHATAAQAAALRQVPLWKAGRNNAYVSDPSVGAGDLHGWPVLTCWQWKGTTIDEDVFYGDASTWKALAVGAPATPPEEDMPLTDDDIRRIWAYKNTSLTTKDAYQNLLDSAKPLDVEALAAAVAAALPADSPVTTDQLVEALKEALGSLNDQPSA